jgi:hypothetical protein
MPLPFLGKNAVKNFLPDKESFSMGYMPYQSKLGD